ncbi:calcium-binding protein CP1-like [Prosopis cineraria]|uniref:calcium-binding protein CP1-like n=1 Tax=Prosopis cineraria TaxID=364024 RepID=UPI00240EC972|nr:calcium-binding protein CP1-like [Prosopis cineraria]
MCPSHRNFRPRGASSSSANAAATRSLFRPAFDVLDVDRDGKISHNDLQSSYGGFCHHETNKGDVIGSMMVAADTNGDGFVEYEEFENVLEMAGGGKSPWGGGLIEEVFRVMDKHDGDGKLSHGDLKCFMEWAGLTVTDQDIDDMIALGGGDRNDGVSFDGFIQILGLES